MQAAFYRARQDSAPRAASREVPMNRLHWIRRTHRWVAMLFVLLVLPVVWGFIRKSQGLPMFGSPTIAQLEDPDYRPGLVGMKKVDGS